MVVPVNTLECVGTRRGTQGPIVHCCLLAGPPVEVRSGARKSAWNREDAPVRVSVCHESQLPSRTSGSAYSAAGGWHKTNDERDYIALCSASSWSAKNDGCIATATFIL